LEPRRFAALAGLLSALSMPGCAYQLNSPFSKGDADVEQTGSIGNADRQAGAAKGAVASETDLAYARAVAADVVGHGAKDSSVPWENPNTGAGGNIMPLAASYNDGSLTCRDFLASYVRGQAQAWLQGEACRTTHGKWEVRSLKPLKQG
jgi:17 kDa outer membrane surface antigen